MHELGFNYRITDFQCALCLSQLQRLDGFIARRRAQVARFPGAEAYYRRALTLPLYPGLAEAEQQRVINIVRAHAEKLAR